LLFPKPTRARGAKGSQRGRFTLRFLPSWVALASRTWVAQALALWGKGVILSGNSHDRRVAPEAACAAHPRRLQWIDEAAFHGLNRGHDRQDIFFDDEDPAPS
jgi:hypothetical protein